jgi:hypothetical protein
MALFVSVPTYSPLLPIALTIFHLTSETIISYGNLPNQHQDKKIEKNKIIMFTQ